LLHSLYNKFFVIISYQLKKWSGNVPKAISKKTEQPKTDVATFVENASKTGTPPNGRRIDFHFVRRKRKAN